MKIYVAVTLNSVIEQLDEFETDQIDAATERFQEVLKQKVPHISDEDLQDACLRGWSTYSTMVKISYYHSVPVDGKVQILVIGENGERIN